MDRFYMLPELAFRSLGGRLLTLEGGGGKKKQPKAPDYTAAAEAQGASGKENLAQQTWANRPTQITPWGRTDYAAEAGVDPATGTPINKWTQTESLTPEAQKALDAQLDITTGRSELAQDQMGRVKESLADPFDWKGLTPSSGGMEKAQQEAYGRMQEFQKPERDIATQELETRLANQGLTPGSEAYNTEMRRQSDQFARQDQQNLMASFGEGRQQGGFQNTVRQQDIAEEAQRRGMSLNEMNALLTGQQVQNPQMPGYSQAGVAPATNYLGAAGMQGQFELGTGAQSNQQSGQLWGGIGSMAGSAAMMM